MANLPAFAMTPKSQEALDQVAQRICVEHEVTRERVCSPDRARNLTAVRVAIVTEAVDGRIATLAEVAKYFGRDPSGLSALLQGYGRR
jgi:hypothetical protein